jgi:hypothetical protein
VVGQFEILSQTLIKNGVIDDRLRWTYKNGHLVIVGNCFGENRTDIDCLWLIYALEEKAQREGGYVHLILGYKDIAGLDGEWRYLHPQYVPKTPTSRGVGTALFDGNNELWRWLCTKNVIERINDILFMNSCTTPCILNTNHSIAEINSLLRSCRVRVNNCDQEQMSDIQINSVLHHFRARAIITAHQTGSKIACLQEKATIHAHSDNDEDEPDTLLIKNTKFYYVDTNGQRLRIN